MASDWVRTVDGESRGRPAWVVVMGVVLGLAVAAFGIGFLFSVTFAGDASEG